MPLFPYDELKYYAFGLRAGTSNLFANGFELGLRKTIGKITQPINSYTRFPEYFFFETAIRDYLRDVPLGWPVKVLDVGSPKMLGLYLAFHFHVEVQLTDISELNLDEYRLIWRSLEPRAKGRALFVIQDARSLENREPEFDVVYSMSVVEHIDGDSGDSQAIREFLRVLKPGGLLILSVPFGNRYAEQQIVGMTGAVHKTNDSQTYFFQRIYDQPAFEERILKFAGDLANITLTAVWRRYRWVHRVLGSLGENVRGVMGFMNPLLSAAVNRSGAGMQNIFSVNYGTLHTPSDLYGDLILTGRKKQSDRR
ncbi:MAG TPA: class I SAM-dependent methyltransferase [Candidatus Acidoferrum sp.]|nr:class I SAM-dependent methyltransferase [Candidatus Acidoferrum sp.]